MRSRLPIFGTLALVATLGMSGPLHGQGQASESAFQRGDRTLRPGDMLRISVWPNEELGGEFVVEESGYGYLPMLGRVRVEGVPIDELRSQLRSGYSEAVKNPVVTITPVFTVGVLGQVRSPGVYSVTPTTTLLDVIGEAGGFTGSAAQEKLRLVREGQSIQFNAERALAEGRGVGSLELRSGDRVVVPTRSRGITFGSVVTFIQTGATIAFLVERALD